MALRHYHKLTGMILPGAVLAAVTLAPMFGAYQASAKQASVSQASPTQASQSTAAAAQKTRLSGNRFRTRFIADISRKVPFRAFMLAGPDRVVIDLPVVKFLMPDASGQKRRGLVKSFRFGLFAKDRSRIVIDVNRPVMIHKAYIIPPKDGRPARFVLDLVAASRKQQLAQMRRERKQWQARLKSDPALNAALGIKADHHAATSASALKPAKTRKATPGKGKITIVIDPGHGGLDPGALSPYGPKEKHIALKFARILQKTLQATGRYKVIMTRNIDVFIPLRERTAIARRAGGDLFVSIHADSIASRQRRKRNRIRGTSIYTLSKKASDEEAEELARKENTSDVLAGVELPTQNTIVSKVLIEWAQRETKKYSRFFARQLVRDMRGVTRLKPTPHRFGDLRVLKSPDIPSVLIELGYLTNRHDIRAMKSTAWRRKMSVAIRKAIDRFFVKRVAITP